MDVAIRAWTARKKYVDPNSKYNPDLLLISTPGRTNMLFPVTGRLRTSL